MVSKLKNTIFFAAAGLMLAGCGNASINAINPTNDLTKQSDEVSGETYSAVKDVKEFKPIVAADCSFVAQTDCQPNVGELQEIAYTEKGYYYKTNFLITGTCGGKLLRFYDYETGLDVAVCSKLECDHENIDCDAYLSGDIYTYINSIWYQNGYVYVPRYYEDYISIEKITPDGTEREISCKLMRSNIKITENDDGSITSAEGLPQIWLHRGYAYFCTYAPGVTPAELYRVKLDSNEEAELLYRIDKQGEGYVMMYRVKPYGRYVMFQMGEYADTDNYSMGIYAYDTETGAISSVCDGAIRDYMIYDEFLYYFDLDNNIHRMNPDTGESALFYENKYSDDSSAKLFGLEDNIVFEQSDLQIVINQKGEEVKKLDLSKDEILLEYSVDILANGN